MSSKYQVPYIIKLLTIIESVNRLLGVIMWFKCLTTLSVFPRRNTFGRISQNITLRRKTIQRFDVPDIFPTN